MDSSANLVSVRNSGCTPQNSSGSFEKPRTTRGDSKRARTVLWKLFKQRRGEHIKCTPGVIFCSPNIGCAPQNSVCDTNLPVGRLWVVWKVWEIISILVLGSSQRGGGIWWSLNLNLLFMMILHWEIILQDYRWKYVFSWLRYRKGRRIHLRLPPQLPGLPTMSLLQQPKR